MSLGEQRKILNNYVGRLGNNVYSGLGDILTTPLSPLGLASLAAPLVLGAGSGCANAQVNNFAFPHESGFIERQAAEFTNATEGNTSTTGRVWTDKTGMYAAQTGINLVDFFGKAVGVVTLGMVRPTEGIYFLQPVHDQLGSRDPESAWFIPPRDVYEGKGNIFAAVAVQPLDAIFCAGGAFGRTTKNLVDLGVKQPVSGCQLPLRFPTEDRQIFIDDKPLFVYGNKTGKILDVVPGIVNRPIDAVFYAVDNTSFVPDSWWATWEKIMRGAGHRVNDAKIDEIELRSYSPNTYNQTNNTRAVLSYLPIISMTDSLWDCKGTRSGNKVEEVPNVTSNYLPITKTFADEARARWNFLLGNDLGRYPGLVRNVNGENRLYVVEPISLMLTKAAAAVGSAYLNSGASGGNGGLTGGQTGGNGGGLTGGQTTGTGGL